MRLDTYDVPWFRNCFSLNSEVGCEIVFGLSGGLLMLTRSTTSRHLDETQGLEAIISGNFMDLEICESLGFKLLDLVDNS